MSAILAVFHRDGEPVDRTAVEAMMAASPDRSVDGQEIWLEKNVALAHQHFWVTKEDLNERQPLASPSGRWMIAADVRLDNRDVLISQLGIEAGAGSHVSDTALILRAFERWGEACVDHLLGDFAFAIWDRREQRLFLARDALGVRGLCYTINHAYCLVASEVRQIMAHPTVRPRINEKRVAAFLVTLWDDPEETFCEGIHYCPPAHCLEVSLDKVRKWRYWDLYPQARIRFKQDRDYAEGLLDLLTQAVACRLRSLGPIAISMSGGLDSTSLAAVASQLLPQADLPQQRLKSFSCIFNEFTSCDERQYIRPVVECLDLEAAYIRCDGMWTLRDPNSWPTNRGFVLSNPYPRLQQAVMAAAQDAGCRLLLGGYYGDVLFTGGRFWAADMLRELRLRELVGVLAASPSRSQWRWHLWDYGLRQLSPPGLRQVYRWLNPIRDSTPHPGLLPDFVARTNLVDRVAGRRVRPGFSTVGQWQRYRSLTSGLFTQGLAAVRSDYHGHGLELSTPYWDRRLVEYVMAVPSDQLGRPHCDRRMLRYAMKKRLPKTVIEPRERTVFLPLMEKGLVYEERDTVQRILHDPQIVERRYVQQDWLRQQLAGERNWFYSEHRFFIWKCLSLELWLRRQW